MGKLDVIRAEEKGSGGGLGSIRFDEGKAAVILRSCLVSAALGAAAEHGKKSRRRLGESTTELGLG